MILAFAVLVVVAAMLVCGTACYVAEFQVRLEHRRARARLRDALAALEVVPSEKEGESA